MGEIADSLIDGEFDFVTGEYLGPGVGYPRTRSGNRPKKKRHKPNPPRPNKEIVYGLIFKEGNPHNISHIQISSIVEEYAHELLKLPQEVKESTVHKHIKRDKAKFTAWFKEKYPHLAP